MSRFFSLRALFAVLTIAWTIRCIQAAQILADRAYMPALAVIVWTTGTVVILTLMPFSRWLITQWRRT